MSRNGKRKWSELFSLQWQDLTLAPDTGSITIQRTVNPVKGSKFVAGEPKTKSSWRTIGIPRNAVEALQDHRATMFNDGFAAKDHLVVCNHVGGYISRTNFLKREHGPAIKRANRLEAEFAKKEHRQADLILVPLRFQDLRHSHASLLLSAGHSLKAVCARLGHAGVEITLKVDGHVMPGGRCQANQRHRGIAQARVTIVSIGHS